MDLMLSPKPASSSSSSPCPARISGPILDGMILLARCTMLLWCLALTFWVTSIVCFFQNAPVAPVMIGGMISTIGAGIMERHLSFQAKRRAREFMREVYDRIAHGDQDHRQWLIDRCCEFEEPLERIMK